MVCQNNKLFNGDGNGEFLFFVQKINEIIKHETNFSL